MGRDDVGGYQLGWKNARDRGRIRGSPQDPPELGDRVNAVATRSGETAMHGAAGRVEGAGNGCGIPKDSGTCQRTEACLAAVE